ncbi:hypothetical protein NPIL_617201 [Nephila pilipes]|uniref:Uncharacterized protein n=1 Tax=Nephila pilipes TaxID=299642 RepID=A0A8X6PLU0_NEPPI|nr:hypothetical protein NPIL_617201 [Nephila pilipes]
MAQRNLQRWVHRIGCRLEIPRMETGLRVERNMVDEANNGNTRCKCSTVCRRIMMCCISVSYCNKSSLKIKHKLPNFNDLGRNAQDQFLKRMRCY